MGVIGVCVIVGISIGIYYYKNRTGSEGESSGESSSSTVPKDPPTWRESDKGVDLKAKEWNGTGHTSLDTCKEKADTAGVSLLSWSPKIYGGYCKVQKPEIDSPDLTTNSGYGYKLFEKA